MDAGQVKPVESTGVHLRAADLFCIVFPFAFGLLLLIHSGGTADRLRVVAVLFAASGGSFLCRLWASRSDAPIAQIFGNFYCILVIWFSYIYLNPLIDALSPVTYDRALQAIDQVLFGVQPSLWLEQHQDPRLTEVLFFCYSSFFGWQLALGVILYLRNNDDFADYFLTIVAFYMLSYSAYVTVPAIGPRFDLAPYFQRPLDGVWLGGAIRQSFAEVAMLRDCFPSGHTGLTLLVLTRALTKKAYTFFWVMLPFALLLFVSTVYCRFHYVADLIAALPFVGGVLLVDWFCRKALPRGVVLGWPAVTVPKKSPA